MTPPIVALCLSCGAQVYRYGEGDTNPCTCEGVHGLMALERGDVSIVQRYAWL